MNRRQKGNNGERAIAQALRIQGLVVRNGPHNETGCDLYAFAPFTSGLILHHEAEVKARTSGTVTSLLTKEKKAIWRRAKEAKALQIEYRLYFVRLKAGIPQSPAWVYTVEGLHPSLRRKGLHLSLNEVGLLNLHAPGEPLHWEGSNAPKQAPPPEAKA